MNSVIRKFKDLPLGTRFRYIGGEEIWVVIEKHGCGLIALWEGIDGPNAGQNICSLADTVAQCEILEVEALDVEVELKNKLAVLQGEYEQLCKTSLRTLKKLVTQDGIMRSWAEWIVKNPPQYGGDWACAECRPDSDMLVEGFVCTFHNAKRFLDPAINRFETNVESQAAAETRKEGGGTK